MYSRYSIPRYHRHLGHPFFLILHFPVRNPAIQLAIPFPNLHLFKSEMYIRITKNKYRRKK